MATAPATPPVATAEPPAAPAIARSLGSGWVDRETAAGMLGVTPGHVGWMARNGHLDAVLYRRRWWVQEASARRVLAERARWISEVGAAALAGCHPRTVAAAAAAGHIERRGVANHSLPSLDRNSVLAWAQERAREAERRAAARAAVERDRAARTGPPDDEHVWLDVTVTALMLGLTTSGVRYRARRDLLPHTRVGARLWFQRAHVEQIAAARAVSGQRRGGAAST